MFPQFCACLTRAPELREPGPVPRLSGEIPAHGLAYRPDAILERSLNAREQPKIVMAGLDPAIHAATAPDGCPDQVRA
jgi:hypothetical protein